MAGFLIVAAGGAGATPSQPPDPHAPIRVVQALDEGRTRIASPAGIAFSWRGASFHVIDGAQTRIGTGGTVVVRLTPGALKALTDRAGSRHIDRATGDPINVTYDAFRNRLLILGPANDLLAVEVDPSGELEPQTLTRWSLARAGIADPQGMAVDPETGSLLVLDSSRSQIVSFEPAADGGFDAPGVRAIDLRSAGITSGRGLAIDPQSGHLFVASSTELIELSAEGDIAAVRDLSDTDLGAIQGMVFAPSGDQTDPADQLSLFVASRTEATGQTAATGEIVELSLVGTVAAETASFTSSLVRSVDMSTWAPPSIDPSGIVYLPPPLDRMMMSDAEVEETVSGITHFQGANVWEFTRSGTVLRTANISKVAPTVVPMTNEPTGVAAKLSTNQYFFSDDGSRRVYTLNAGGDGQVGTSDDTWSSFSTTGVGNADPEGITYDPTSDHLFVVDGVNAEVYQYTLAGALVGQFDVAQYGVTDPESVEFNAATGTLFTLSNKTSGPIVVETTTSGALLQTIDVSAIVGAGGKKPAGLAIAPASDGSGAIRFYIIDRGIDNNVNPSIVDGKMFELTAPSGGVPGNLAPSVDAGPDLAVTLPASANLDGTVTDDGLPDPPGAVTVTWTAVTGPGTVTFGDPNAIDTTAGFSAAGTYVLRLTANDSVLSGFDDVVVTVSAAGASSPLYVALRDSVTVGGVKAANEDILFYDGASGFSLHFDGSDVGIGALRVDGFAIVDATTLLFSFDADASVPGIGLVDDSDIVTFKATSLGPTTAGTFAMYFDGSDVGLTTSAHDVDAFEVLPDGRIVVSTLGTLTVGGITARDEDMLVFTPTSLGDTTAGSFAWYFDGSDVGLGDSGEDINAVTVDSAGRILLSTLDPFSVTQVSGDDEDVFVFTPSALGSTTAGSYAPGLYFDGSMHGLAANDVFAIELP